MRLPHFLAALLVFGLTISLAQAQPASSPQDNLDPRLLYGGAADPPDAPPPSQPPLKPAPKLQPLLLKRTAPSPAVAPVAKRTPPPPVPAPRFDPQASPALSFAYPEAGGTVDEGGQTLVWNTSGPIVQVRLTYEGAKCALGGRSRGSFSGTIGKLNNEGKTVWAAPWLDASELKLRLVGYDAGGKELASTEVQYQFLPRVCADKPDHCLVISKARQRLWYLREGKVRRMHIVSTAARGYLTPNMRPGSHDRRRGAMGRVFRKAYAPVSGMYNVVMYYWLQITSSGSHGIHATTPRFYGRLGGPASHGCVRQHKSDARVLYELVPVGTPVYIQ